MKIEKSMYPEPFATSIAAMIIGASGSLPKQAIVPEPQTKVINDDAYVITFGTPSRIAGKTYDKSGNVKNIYM